MDFWWRRLGGIPGRHFLFKRQKFIIMLHKFSYFRLSLLSYLKESHPHLANDTAFIAAHGDAAAKAYSTAIKNEQTHEQVTETANEVLYVGLLFSSYRILVRILWYEFEKEVTPDLAEGVAIGLLPKLTEVLANIS